MKTYVKTLLYSYTRLKRITEDYQEHIKNKAYLSYDNRMDAEKLVEYMANEIVRSKKLKELMRLLDVIMGRFTEEEKFLLEVRYFRRKQILMAYKNSMIAANAMARRSYFRKQARLLLKAERLFEQYGLTEEKFLKEYASFEALSEIYQYIEKGKDNASVGREQCLFNFLSDGKKDVPLCKRKTALQEAGRKTIKPNDGTSYLIHPDLPKSFCEEKAVKVGESL